MDGEKDDIGKILSDFREQKERRIQAPPEPPVKREEPIDFAKAESSGEVTVKAPEKKKEPKPKKSPEELEAIKAGKKEKRAERNKKIKAVLIKVKRAVFNKKTFIACAAILAVTGISFGIGYAVKQSKSAYLKEYEKKYPDAEFQVGMQEKYCDILGENPDTVGYIEIPEINLKSTVSSDRGKYPCAQGCTDGAQQFNYVVYLEDNSLEEIYSSADAYNKAGGYITYSDLFEDYSFKVVGAFYTNTKAQDDDGYIFPYNVTEKMTVSSANNYVSMLESRFIYSTGVTITRQDKILTVSCPTDYREDFRFVVIGVMRESTGDKLTAAEKNSVRYPQVIYDETGLENPYRFAAKWYPEIIVTDGEGNEKTVKKSIEDYE